MAGKRETKAKYQHFVPAVRKVDNWYKNFNFVLIENMEDLKNIFRGLTPGKYFMSFDTETTGLNFEELELVGYSFSLDGKTAYYVPVYHFEYEHNLGEPAVEFIYCMMVNAAKVFMYNARYDLRVFEFRGYKDVKNVLDKKRWKFVKYDMSKVNYYDVAVAVWAADTNQKMPSLKWASEHFLGFEQMHFDEVIEKAGNFFYLNPSENPDVTFYAAADALCTYLLVPVTIKYFQEGQLATKVDNKVLYPLMHYETEKLWLDKERIETMLIECQDEVDRLEREVYEMIGYQINLNSPVQVAQAFQRLGIDTGEKTESGGMATGMKILENLPDHVKEQFPALKSFVEYKETFKLMSSYFSVLKKEGERNGFLRGAYQTTNVPCLTESANVFVQGKGMISIRDVQVGDMIWTQYGYKKVLWNNSHWSDDVYKLTLKDGTVLEGTGHHPVLVNTTGRREKIHPEWSALVALKNKERVIMNSHPVQSDMHEIDLPEIVWEGRLPLRKKGVEVPKKLTLELARFFGYMDGDGCIKDDRIQLSFNTQEPEIISYYTNLFEKIFKGIGKPLVSVEGNSTTYNYFSKLVVQFCTEMNLRQKKEDRVCEYIRKAGPEFWIEYLCGLWDTDGCLANSGSVGKIYQPRVKTVKKGMMEDVFNLLKGLSIDCSFHERVSSDTHQKNQYEIVCINRRGLVLFHNFIGSRLIHNMRRGRSEFNYGYIKNYYDINQVIFEGKLEKIEPSLVYDIEVEDVHEYVANGIVTHNTGRLSAGKDSKNTYFSPINLQALPKPHVCMYDVFDLGDRNLYSRKDNILMGYKFVQSKYDQDKKHIIPDDPQYIGWAEGMNPKLNVRSCIIPKMYEDSGDDEFIYVACDYAAQELRITANISKEPVWANAFIEGRDVHKSCYSLDTEMLTPDGWRTYDQITEDTLIGQYNPESKMVEWVSAGPIYWNETSEMYHFKGTNTDLLVTPNHRMYVNVSGELEVMTAEELVACDCDSFEIPGYRDDEPFTDTLSKQDVILLDYGIPQTTFCYSVPTGLLVVRRNSKISVCGNTAVQLWGEENYNKDLRKRAKGVNFGVIYGMGAPSMIDPKYGIHTLADAEAFFEQYKSALPTLFQWIDRVQRAARRNGTVCTFFGRPRRVKGYYDAHNAGFANRTATNTQIQGCLPYESLILTDRGYRKIGDLYVEFQNLNQDMKKWDYKVWNGFEWCDFFPVERGKDVRYRLHFSNGQIIDCDSRHKVKVSHEGSFDWVDVNDLIEGSDAVCFMKGLDWVCQRDEVTGFAVEDYDYQTIVQVEKTEEEIDTYTLCVLNDLHQFVSEGMISKNTAGDILKIVMCKLWQNLLDNEQYKDDVRFMVTIHDEIGYSVRASKAPEIIKMIEDTQTFTIPQWPIPLICEASMGWSMGGIWAIERVEDPTQPNGYTYRPKLDD